MLGCELEGAELITANAVTEAELRASTTEWQVGDTEATIVIHRDPTEEVEFTLRNVDGRWY